MAWELNTISSVVLSLLHHTDAVAVLFLLVEGSAMLALSSHPTHLLPRSVCVCVFMCLCECVCVCFRKWCSASLCKFIRDRAETKISSLKQVRQPFGRHVPCLPCVRCICSGACPCSYYHFFYVGGLSSVYGSLLGGNKPRWHFWAEANGKLGPY